MDALDRPGTAKLAQVLHVGPRVLDAPGDGWRCSKQAGGNSCPDWQERLQRAPEGGRSSHGVGGEVAAHTYEGDDTIEHYPERGGEDGGDDQGVDPHAQANDQANARPTPAQFELRGALVPALCQAQS